MNDTCCIFALPGHRRARAFTLPEVMVSLALVVMIVMGVSQVFKMSSDATRANQAISTILRDHRAARATFAADFTACVPDSPAFIISSRVGAGSGAANNSKGGYRDAEEQRKDNDSNPMTVNIDGTNFTYAVSSTSDRVPRLDTLAYFVRGKFRRQNAISTETGGPFGTTATANEAYLWYGHLNRIVRNSSGTAVSFDPPENTYGSDRTLGRVAILLRDPSSGVGTYYWQTGGTTAQLRPLGYSTPASSNSDSGLAYANAQILGARYDLANTSVELYRQRVDNAYTAGVPNTANARSALSAANPSGWFRDLVYDYNATFTWPTPFLDHWRVYRFFYDPTLTRPLTPQKMAYTTPAFVEHCTQFVVEYAGDYLKQNPDGTVVNGGYAAYRNGPAITTGITDGQVDFIYDATTQTRRVRWYGLPRDVDGDGLIDATKDVLPLADVYSYYASALGITPGVVAPWEVHLPNPPVSFTGSRTDYPTRTSISNAQQFRYVCAFHNDAPLMIRILMKIDDPSKKLQDGQWYEYILSRQ